MQHALIVAISISKIAKTTDVVGHQFLMVSSIRSAFLWVHRIVSTPSASLVDTL